MIPQQHSFTGPLYRQVHSLIKARIEAGEWRQGRPMPGEADLSRELQVSIGTVRKALDMLARDRVVVRARGRGTYVQDDRTWRPDVGLCFYDAVGQPLRPDVAVTDCRAGIASQDEAKALGHGRIRGERLDVVRIEREWRRGDDLLCREVVVIEAARFPGIAAHLTETKEALEQIYGDRYGTTIARFEWSMHPVPRDDTRLQAFADPRRVGAVNFIRVAFDGADEPIEYCNQLIGIDKESLRLIQ